MVKKKPSEILEDVKARALMYLGSYSFQTANSFINGFTCGINAISSTFSNSLQERNRVLTSRGWKVPSVRIDLEMNERGLSPEQVVNEVFEIEIAVWKRLEETQESHFRREE